MLGCLDHSQGHVIDSWLESCLKRRATKKVQPVLGGFDQNEYRTDRLWASAPDGIKVPMSIVYKQGLVKLDGSDPLLLDGCVHLTFKTPLLESKPVHACPPMPAHVASLLVLCCERSTA